MAYCSTTKSVLALVGVRLLDGIEVSSEANLAGVYLRDGWADRSVYASI
jgi:hypothetical protein